MESLVVLERPLYGFSEVDDLLDLAGGTARRWIDGYERHGRPYPPVIRAKTTGSESVTWGEFVETGLLAQYRDVGVPMQRLRPVVQALRKELGVPYPLAHARPLVLARELVIRVQEDVGLEDELQIAYAPRTGQYLLTPRAAAFVDRIEWADDVAGAIRAAPDSPVTFDPLRSFGSPTVDGIRTDIIAELARSGESQERIATVYDLTPKLVRAAVDFEAKRAV